jgi:hypothetical protein
MLSALSGSNSRSFLLLKVVMINEFESLQYRYFSLKT